MRDPIFRKVALERQASPEQLDSLMQVTTPKGWIALLGFGSLLILGLVWAFFTTIQVTVPGRGVLTARKDLPGELEAVLYVSVEDAAKIRPGFDAKIAPSTVRSNEGQLVGTVASVAAMPSAQKDMLGTLGNDTYVQSLAASGALVEVRVRLTPEPGTPSGLRWTTLNGPPFALQPGTLAAGTVVVSQQSPFNLILLRR